MVNKHAQLAPFFRTACRITFKLSGRLNKSLLQHALSLDTLPQQAHKVTGNTWAQEEAVKLNTAIEYCRFQTHAQ